MTRSVLIAFSLFFVTTAVCGVSLAAAPDAELGLKVPLAALASVAVDEGLRLEASAVFPGLTAPLVSWEGRLAAKIFPYASGLEVGGFTVSPFVGLGAVALYVEPAERVVPGLMGLVGAEHPAQELPLTAFLEGSGTLLMSGAGPSWAFELSAGVRYRLP